MTEVATVPKKWIREYQPKDENGYPIGPPQKFEADTQQELIDKLAAAHENASAALYKTRQQVKLGAMLEPDPDEPLQTFESKTLTAEERLKASKMLADPATVVEGYKILSEAVYGAPPEKVQESLREREISKRVDSIRAAIALFVKENPAYVECEGNSDKMKKYMEKNNLRYTAKNLKIAFEDLSSDGLLTVRTPQAAVPATPVVTPVTTNAPAVPEAIPPAPTTPAPAIPVEPTEVRPKNSSSGLGRENSSAVPGITPPKTPGISIRDINKLSAAEYQDKLRDPEFRKAVEALYAKK
jgi:hypothetical protein